MNKLLHIFGCMAVLMGSTELAAQSFDSMKCLSIGDQPHTLEIVIYQRFEGFGIELTEQMHGSETVFFDHLTQPKIHVRQNLTALEQQGPSDNLMTEGFQFQLDDQTMQGKVKMERSPASDSPESFKMKCRSLN